MSRLLEISEFEFFWSIYVVLAYHLANSRTYRAVCGFGIADKVPSGSTLQRDIKKIRARTLEATNRILLASAAAKGIEKGRKVRIDCTVVESNIHHPTDSSLLWDSVVVVSDHRRRAKRRALGILNASTKKQRVKLYRDLLKVARKSVRDAERVRRALKVLPTTELVKTMILEAELQLYHWWRLGIAYRPGD